MPISSVHAEYSSNTERWRRNRAACAGQDEVKQVLCHRYVAGKRKPRLRGFGVRRLGVSGI